MCFVWRCDSDSALVSAGFAIYRSTNPATNTAKSSWP